ncbi:type I secretion system permease/ATPase [Sinorhizobium meliloti]|uniref:Type I secretion system ATP-binding protein PrsD n=6 Tax=Rhizobium meliloti TaxID=382 RepID=PRSD_RHIME|nr:type I secretion system permease/ATPase [Sinorhizobium meliloti]Q7ANN4.2 RecName: Full=Type I secretion system ATP-binding protein PrsD [Sinorhizobium meliloti 1021]TWA87918.1 ATP-binding protein PrsD [Ensifer sp. SEMIA 134]TWB23007.1 ATP-binding protein PrsD [Ensifer sp. SEMIA 135]AAB64091.1 PrsD [Sinorhizobium meliloti]ASP62808.1 type I secretion system permease/ATPase [Sinorhizobium meliloti]ASQ00349.1 type I secretion system permease/ATPase [Sinorhizobium meliloti]
MATSKGRNADPAAALRDCRAAFIGVGVASALVNLLYLTGSFFMLEVYDRILPSRSIPSLIALSLLALLLYAFQGAFELIRGRMLVRIAGALDESLNGRIYRAIVKAPLKLRMQGDGLQALRDFDQVRSFLSGVGPAALFDLPWLPFYIAICFLFHPVIGLIAIIGGLILTLLTYLTNRGTQAPAKKASEAGGLRNVFAQASQRNAEVVHAMGMSARLTALWERRNTEFRDENRRTSDIGNGYGALSKVFRMALQSGVLAAGAVLVIRGEASPGIIIAGSILTARALAPVELAIGNWRGLVAARQSWQRLKELLNALPEADAPLQLPDPHERLTVEGLASGPPAAQRLVVSDVNFTVRAGGAVGVIGPSASGKSSLARAILGIWPAYRGSVRLDGAALDQWDSDALGKHVGYLPQDVELFAGTIAQNICRFAEDATSEAIVAAAKAARVNDLILRLPNGYDTEIGDGGMTLSAGQRQRVALARALYGDPFLVVLDEPNSNLDAEGEQALSEAIMSVRSRGGIVIVVAHRPSALASVDLVLMMNEGRMQAFGPKEQVLGQVLRPQQVERQNALKVVAEGQEAKQ